MRIDDSHKQWLRDLQHKHNQQHSRVMGWAIAIAVSLVLWSALCLMIKQLMVNSYPMPADYITQEQR